MMKLPDLHSAINLDAAKDWKEGRFENKVKEIMGKN